MEEYNETTVETPSVEQNTASGIPDYSLIWGGNSNNTEYPEADAQQEMAEFVDMTNDEVLEAICELDAGGRLSQSDATVTLSRIVDYAHKIDENGELLEGVELTDDDTVSIRETEVSSYVLKLGTIDGIHTSVDFTFSSPEDFYLEEFSDICAQFTEEMGAFMSGESPDLPMLILNVMPFRSEGRYMVNFSNPIGINRTIDDEGIPNTLTLLYHIDDIEIDTYEYTRQELNQIKDDAYNRERRKLEYEDSEASQRELFS